MRNVSTLGFLVLLPLAGCADAAQSILERIASEAEARQAMSAMVAALSDAQPSAQHQSETVHRAAGDGEQVVDATAPCQDGGKIRFSGTLDLQGIGDTGLPDDWDPTSGDIPTGTDVNPSVGFSYTVSFDGCTVEGVVLDGALEYALETSWDGAKLDASWDYEGSVDVTGAVVGHCDFSFGGTGDLSAEDWAGGVPAGFEGDACGYDAEVLGE